MLLHVICILHDALKEDAPTSSVQPPISSVTPKMLLAPTNATIVINKRNLCTILKDDKANKEDSKTALPHIGCIQ